MGVCAACRQHSTNGRIRSVSRCAASVPIGAGADRRAVVSTCLRRAHAADPRRARPQNQQGTDCTKTSESFPKESTSTVFGADQHMLPLYVGLQVRAAAISCYGAVYSAVGESLLTSSHLSNIKPAMLKCVCLSHPSITIS